MGMLEPLILGLTNLLPEFCTQLIVRTSERKFFFRPQRSRIDRFDSHGGLSSVTRQFEFFFNIMISRRFLNVQENSCLRRQSKSLAPVARFSPRFCLTAAFV